MYGLEMARFPLSAKVFCTLFLIGIGCGTLAAFTQAATAVGLSPTDVRASLAPEMPMTHLGHGHQSAEKEIDLGQVSAAAKVWIRTPLLIQTSHTHLFGQTLIAGVLGLIFLFASLREWLKAAILALPFVGTLIDIGGMWLTRFAWPGLATLVIVGAMRHSMAVIAVAGLALTMSLTVAGGPADANGLHGPARPDEPPTAFERFVLGACSPCVKEVHRIAGLTAPSLRITSFGRGATGPTTRPGEIGVDVLRASWLGRPSRQRLALSMTLMVVTGTAGEMYRLGTGLLDEEEIGPLVDAIGEMARAIATAPATGDEQVDIGFHGGSLRVGVVRLKGETVAYVQAGDIATLALRPVWEVPTTMFVAANQLPALANVIGQAAARIQKLRAGP